MAPLSPRAAAARNGTFRYQIQDHYTDPLFDETKVCTPGSATQTPHVKIAISAFFDISTSAQLKAICRLSGMTRSMRA
ncbi:hypothetical protein CMQ_2720 [Grosmannia clavigera kw1407]|uniref:Uncharacterized protein n=1 Tax=Grosmannia clavigera (strain kw1407 / UAMH 11150) TaxID=655863 RepID=F0XH83_GROCL|nr:uncharacterized protein CMQ_2720 [Grosmannia clavigera kw1407]EFX02791.1 hypothetical protein CMQ_2720 [Grosmannia clavigera kw1407]